jgi:hypothetical protein
VRAAACCECNAETGPGELVAISDEEAFASLVCNPAFGCDDCLPAYPREAIAVCEAGDCVVEDPRLF